MKRRWMIVLAATVGAVLGLGATALYAYDLSRSDMVAKGITVAGVDIGGLSAGRARETLRRALAARLERPVVVRVENRRFVLSPQEAEVRVDAAGMVQHALAKSRDGFFVRRAVRELSGGKVRASLPARVRYSPDAVRALVERVKSAINRPPQDATVTPSASTLAVRPSRDGVTVRSVRLRWAIARALFDPTGPRIVDVPTKTTKPRVTTQRLAKKYPFFITINRGQFKLRLFRNLKLAKTYTIAVGQIGLETPAGLYHVQNKAINPAWHVPMSAWAGSLAGTVIPGGTAENPLKARWLGIYDGAGIHGTDATYSLGHAASHGCIRMSIPDVIELYSIVPIHTPVYVG
jgi:lipoprotein-anchoring transpeptidase ErfK/SrfK